MDENQTWCLLEYSQQRSPTETRWSDVLRMMFDIWLLNEQEETKNIFGCEKETTETVSTKIAMEKKKIKTKSYFIDY